MKLKYATSVNSNSKKPRSPGRSLSQYSVPVTSEHLNQRQNTQPEVLLKFSKNHSFPSEYISEFDALSVSDMKSMKSVSTQYSNDEMDSRDKMSEEMLSLYSEDTCLGYDDDSDSVNSYRSSISLPVKKRKCTSDDIQSQYSDPKKYCSELNSKCNESNSVNYKFNRVMCRQITWFILFCLLLIFVFIFVIMSVFLCQQQNNYIIPQKVVVRNLTKCLIGQEHAVSLIRNAIDKFNSKHIDQNIHFVWWVGPLGVGKSFAKQLIKNSLSSSVNFMSVLCSLLPNDENEIENHVYNLINKLDACKPNIFFIDGFDQENFQNMKLIQTVMNHLSEKTELTDSIHLRVLVVVIGTFQSNKVNQFYTDFVKDSLTTRTNFNYSELQSDLLLNSPFSKVLPPSSVTVVPFLPLEEPHIEKCIIIQLNFISKNIRCHSKIDDELRLYLKIQNLTLEQINAQVFELNKHYIDTKLLGSVTSLGCKRVYQIVSYLLFQTSI